VLHEIPQDAHKFYQEVSKLGRPEPDGIMGITTTVTVGSLSLSLHVIYLFMYLLSFHTSHVPLFHVCIIMYTCILILVGLFNISIDNDVLHWYQRAIHLHLFHSLYALV
jgi:hypothetical protein